VMGFLKKKISRHEKGRRRNKATIKGMGANTGARIRLEGKGEGGILDEKTELFSRRGRKKKKGFCYSHLGGKNEKKLQDWKGKGGGKAQHATARKKQGCTRWHS